MMKTEMFEDLSGIPTDNSPNPYDALIEACASDPQQIQDRYDTHRKTRNQQQKAFLLSKEFRGFNLDPILTKLLDRANNPGFVDPRNCLVFWARPPLRLRELVAWLQEQLRDVAPNLWLMPLDCLHMTVLEVAHSRTEDEIADLVHSMQDDISKITDYTTEHRACLINPIVSYDASAIALSFLPAAGGQAPSAGNDHHDYAYTYHHLRRDIYSEVKKTGVDIASRYVVPSSHLTIARFVTQKDFANEDASMDHVRIQNLVGRLEGLNGLLEKDHWSKYEGEWVVGEEKGLVCRRGTVWYGGGESQHEGRGFSL